MVSLLEADDDLAGQLGRPHATEAAGRALVRTIRVPVGRWAPAEQAPTDPGLLGFFVLDGLLARGVTLADHRSADLVMFGDVVRPFEGAADGLTMIPSQIDWRVLEPATLAVLDSRFVREMCAYPEIIAALAGRPSRRTAALAERLAITHQPRVSARLLFLLWQLAEHSGVIKKDGVLLRLRLTHKLLAELVSASRSRVCDAAQELKHERLAWRTEAKHWWLAGVPPEGILRPGDVERSLGV